jgi:hypothetical protein
MAWFDTIEHEDGYPFAVIAFGTPGGAVDSISAPASFVTYS